MFKKVVLGDFEDILVLSLEREIDENDMVVSDYGIICDVFVDLFFLFLDYKKIIGKWFRYFLF